MVGKSNKMMKNQIQLTVLLKQFYKDYLVLCTIVFLIFVTISLSCFVSFFLGFITLICFGTGCCLAVLLLRKFEQLENIYTKFSKIFNANEAKKRNILNKCDVCGIKQCGRHQQTGLIIKEPWKGMFIDKDLDAAVDMFFTKILTDFVESWYTLLSSNNEDFILAIKQNIREAICRLVIKIKQVNIPNLLSNKLIPHILGHYHLINQWLTDGVPMDRLPKQFQQSDQTIHPAVLNRTAEIEYLRSIAKCLLIRLCDTEHLDSKIYFTLLRELLAHHVLLPLMDVIADPNLINLLAIVATNKTKINIPQLDPKNRVIFLEEFVNRKSKSINQHQIIHGSDNHKQEEYEDKQKQQQQHQTIHLVTPLKSTSVLNDQDHLYAFMQFLKKENVVDVLRFYLDVEGLNQDLLDPKVTTDPAKLSTLQQYSEKLLNNYHLMIEKYHLKVPIVAETLNDAHSNVKYILLGKYQREFRKKVDYFRLIYGSREIKEIYDGLDRESETNTGFSISSKLKGALRLAIDGAPLDGTEIPTVWDTFHDDSSSGLTDVSSSTPLIQGGSSSSSSSGMATGTGGNQLQNPKIYSGVTHKLRKERGQHLENFITFFMQSIENITDIGEDMTDDNNRDTEKLSSTDKFIRNRKRKITPPGHNYVFGDLFELRKLPHDRRYNHNLSSNNSFSPLNGLKGASVCLIYILVNILKTPRILVRILLGLISVSKKSIDSLVNKLLDRLVRFGVYEPHLTILVTSLTEHIFETKLGGKDDLVSPGELLERQRQAKKRMENVWKGLSNITDVLQSPPLNKHLMYCLLDIVLIELYPELEQVD